MKINGINTQLKNDYKLELLTNEIKDYKKIIPQSQRNNFQQQRTRNVYTKKHTKKYQFRSVNNSFNLEDEGGSDIELDAVSKIVPIDSDICIDPEPRKIKRTNSCETTKIKHFEDFEIYNDNFITHEFITKKQEEENSDNAEKFKEMQNQLSQLKRENTKLQTQNMEYKTKLYRTKKNTFDYKQDKSASNIERKYKRENEELKQKVKKLEDEVKMLNELLHKNKIHKNENKLKFLHISKGDRFSIIPKKKIQKNNSFNIKKNSSSSQKNIRASKYTSYNSTIHNKARISNNLGILDNIKGDEIKETKQKSEVYQFEKEVISTEKSIKEKNPLSKKRSLPDKFETQPNKEDIQNIYHSPSAREESLQININDYNDEFFEDFPLSPPKIQENYHVMPLPLKSMDDKQAFQKEPVPEEKKSQPQIKPKKEKSSLIMSVLNDDFCGNLLCQNNFISTQNESETQRSRQRNSSVEKFLTNGSNLYKKEKGSKISKYIKRK